MNTVVVTGAAGGMGRAVVERCLADGFGLLAVDIDGAGLAQLADAHRGSVTAIEFDIGRADVGEVIAAALPDGLLKGIVNLAGISRGAAIATGTDADWDRSMAVNVNAPMRICRSLVPRMIEGGGGSIVNVSSPVAVLGARKVAYSASKAALLGLNVAMARDLGRWGIRVNAVFPGATITGLTDDWPAEKRAAIAKESFLGRLCTPEEVASVVSFLLGSDSSFITGTVIDVTGGAALGAH